MLSDEEKKAIDKINKSYDYNTGWVEADAGDWRIVTDLIEKQSKEIEELKKYKEGYKLLSYSLDNCISKDKIKAKIEELGKEQKENKKNLHKAIDLLWDAEIDKITNKILVNLSIRETLQSLLEKE